MFTLTTSTYDRTGSPSYSSQTRKRNRNIQIGKEEVTLTICPWYGTLYFSSVAQSCPTLCDSMNCSARLPCPSPTPRAFSNSCPLSQWCYLTTSTSVDPFFSCPQSFPASGSFPMSWFFVSGGQGSGASAPASVLPMNIQGWFPLEMTGLISLLSKGLSRVFCSNAFKMILLISQCLSCFLQESHSGYLVCCITGNRSPL